MSSISEVSKVAGVSIATVSRVINNNSRVRPEMANAVRSAMRRLSYVPLPDEHRGRWARAPADEMVDQLFADGQRQTGWYFPDSDNEVVGVYRALHARGLRVGAGH